MLPSLKILGFDYKFVVHATNGVVGLRENDCHNEVVALTICGGKSSAVAKGAKTVNAISRLAAWLSLTDDQTSMSYYEYVPQFVGIPIPKLDPYKVTGTNPGSVYTVIVATPFGYVARKDADGLKAARIRVVKSLPGPWPNSQTGNVKWETITADHMSFTAIGASAIAIVVATGVDTLLTMGKVG